MPSADALLLAFDAASPRVSVALGRGGEVLTERAEDLERSSRRLLEMIDESLREIGCAPTDLGGIAVLRGPGSFTGLRVGLATALGLHQALGISATALSTLDVLSSLAPPALGVVDALRSEWSIAKRPGGDIERLTEEELATLAPCTLIGFGVSRLADRPGWPAGPAGIRLLEPGPLAPAALALLARPAAAPWDPALLTQPLYARPPAVTLPRPRRMAGAAG